MLDPFAPPPNGAGGQGQSQGFDAFAAPPAAQSDPFSSQQARPHPAPLQQPPVQTGFDPFVSPQAPAPPAQAPVADAFDVFASPSTAQQKQPAQAPAPAAPAPAVAGAFDVFASPSTAQHKQPATAAQKGPPDDIFGGDEDAGGFWADANTANLEFDENVRNNSSSAPRPVPFQGQEQQRQNPERSLKFLARQESTERPQGVVLARLSLRSLVVKSWRPTFWIFDDEKTVLLYRNRQDWLLNPKGTAIKARINIGHNFIVGEVKFKEYRGIGRLHHFTLDEMFDYGPQTVAKFAGHKRGDIEAIYRCLEEACALAKAQYAEQYAAGTTAEQVRQRAQQERPQGGLTAMLFGS